MDNQLILEDLKTKAIVSHIAYKYSPEKYEEVVREFFWTILYSVIIYIVIVDWVPHGELRTWLLPLLPVVFAVYAVWKHSKIRKLKNIAANAWLDKHMPSLQAHFKDLEYDKEDAESFDAIIDDYCKQEDLPETVNSLFKYLLNFEIIESYNSKEGNDVKNLDKELGL